MNFFMNSGSIPIIFCLIILNFFAFYCLNLFARLCFRCTCCRKIGLEADSRATLKYGLTKLLTEGYIDLTLSSSLMVLAIYRSRSNDVAELSEWFSDFDNCLCSVTAIATFLMCLGLPWYIKYVTKKYGGRLQEPEMQAEYGVYFEDIDVGTEMGIFYSYFTVVRRLWIIGVLIVLARFPVFQMAIITTSSLMHLALLIGFPTYTSKGTTRMEIVNEGTLYVACICQSIFLLESDS